MVDSRLFNAILSMDAYNRGYEAGIQFEVDPETRLSFDQQIGNVTIGFESDLGENSEQRQDGFYAVEYRINGLGSVISYRGTDNVLGSIPIFFEAESGSDIWNGWGAGTGSISSNQSGHAFDFFNTVIGNTDPRLANVITTGHSLGGGLAGLVAGAHGLDGDLFDNMPFEFALAQTNNVASFSPDLQNLIYQGNAPWNTNLDDLHSYSLDGEVLSPFRITQVGTADTEYDLGPNVNLIENVPDAVALHSMSSLVIRMFAETELGGSITWTPAAQYLWELLYDDGFANQIGFNDDNSDVIGGTSLASEKYADILRSTIAYSAIEGGANSTTVFGDTAIRALYNDANDLGAALTASTNTQLDTYGTVISQAFVQFAGTLALNKIEQAGFADALNGVLTHSTASNNQTLTVDFSNDLWTSANGGEALNNIVSKNNMVNGILFSDPDPANVARYKGYMQELWGDDTANIIDRVIFPTIHSGTTNLEDNSNAGAKTTLFVTGLGVGAQTVTGSNVDNFIMGSIGDDNLSGGTGRDLLIGGFGADTLIGGSSNDLIFGGSGNDLIIGGAFNDYTDYDIADYSNSTGSVIVEFDNELVTDGWGYFDTVIYIDQYNLSDQDDTVIVYDTSQMVTYDPTFNLATDSVFHGGGGTDELVMLEHGTMDWRDGNLSIWNGQGNGRSYFTDFEKITISEGGEGGGETMPFGGIFILDEATDFNAFDMPEPDSMYLDYTAANVALTYDDLQFNGTQQVSNVQGGVYSWDYDANRISQFRGGHFGGAYNVRADSYVRDFFTGTGDDTFTISGLGGSDAITISYSDGDDTYNVTGALQSVKLNSNINLADVSVTSLTSTSNADFEAILTIQGRGTLTLNYTDAPADTVRIEFANGDRIEIFTPHVNDNSQSVSYQIIDSGNADTIDSTGTWGVDHFNGDAGVADFYRAYGGNDILNGYDMDDILHGGAGDDLINGGADNDTLYGNHGDDLINGGVGDDDLYGSQGTDSFVFEFGFGNDTIYDYEAGELIDLTALTSVFSLLDLSVTASGSDSLITVGSEGTILVVGKDSTSWAEEDFTFATPPIVTGTINGEALYGTTGGDTINGLAGLDYLHGYEGNDIIYGGYGEDRLYGNDGDDVLYGERDNDRIYGHQGNDTIYGDHGWDLLYGLQGDDTLYGGIGNDVIRGDDASALDDYIGAGNDTIYGEKGSDSISGGAGNDLLYGDDGNDVIYGNAGTDTLYGGNHVDRLYGLDDNDIIYGEHGNDYLYGGFGDDIQHGGDGSDRIYGNEDNDTQHGGDGNDYLYGNDGNDTLNGDAGIDRMYGHLGDDTMNGGADNDQLYGFEGNDILYGGTGADRLIGDDDPATPDFVGAGNDTLYGNEGDDILGGGAGDDRLYGGAGVDALYGNTGADVFAYELGDADGNKDYIHDFSLAESDVLNLSDVLDFDPSGGDVISDFVSINNGTYHSTISVDQDGTGTDHSLVELVQIQNNTGFDLNTMINDGTLIVE